MPTAIVDIIAAGKKEDKEFGWAKTADGRFHSVEAAVVPALDGGGKFEITFTKSSAGRNFIKKAERRGPPPSKEESGGGSIASTYNAQRSIEIWCNAMCQHAIDQNKLDPWNEEAMCEFVEVQKRVFRRSFLGEEAPVQTNGPTPPAPGKPRPGTEVKEDDPYFSDQIPF